MPTDDKPTALHRILDRALRESHSKTLEQFVTELRKAGESWESCGRAVSIATDEPVSYVSLRNWFPHLTKTEVPA